MALSREAFVRRYRTTVDLLEAAEQIMRQNLRCRHPEPWDYFFDHLGESRELPRLGKRVKKAPMLTGILQMVGGQVYQREAKVQDLQLTSLPKHHFLHGACFLAGRLATLLYFADIKMGVLSLDAPDKTYFVRFTNMGVVPASGDDDQSTVTPIPSTRGVVH